MKTLKCSITLLLYLSLCMPLALAQSAPQNLHEAHPNKTVAQDVVIIIQQDQVRFSSEKPVAQIQLQIFDRAGQLVFDSGTVAGPELTWAMRQSSGEMVENGLYAYTLSLKEEGAQTARVRRGHLIVDRARERDGQTDRVWITSHDDSGVGAESTVARNEGMTVAGASAPSEQKSVRAGEGTTSRGESEPKKENNSGMSALVLGTTGQIPKFISGTDLGDSTMSEQNGKVGVGTTSPISKFHIVSGASDHLPPRIESSGTNTFAAGLDFYHGTTGAGYVGVPDGGTGIAPGEMLIYGVGTTSLWAGRQRSVTIVPNGNVGIGTDTPFADARLHVIGNSNGTAVRGASATGTGVRGVSSSGAGVIGSTTSGSGVVGVAGPNGNAALFDGNVRVIGHVLPADKGAFDIGQDGLHWRFLHASHIFATGIHHVSDARLKKGVANLRYGLRELMQLRPVTYEWKDHSPGQQQLGLIAQETEQIIPEAVTRSKDPEKPLVINYAALIPVVIKAVQQQQTDLTTLKNENEALQQRNATLQQQNADLEARLTALEQMVKQVLGAAAGSQAHR